MDKPWIPLARAPVDWKKSKVIGLLNRNGDGSSGFKSLSLNWLDLYWPHPPLDECRYKSSLGQGIGRAASTPPFDKLPFLGTGPSYRSIGTSIDSAIGKVRHGITLRSGAILRTDKIISKSRYLHGLRAESDLGEPVRKGAS
ncbi:hypothetical protein RYX36_022703 [Vicia faba]